MEILWIAHHLGCREKSKDELSEGPIPVVGTRGNYLQHLYSCDKVILTVTVRPTVARRPASLMACLPYSEVADAGGVVN